MSRLVSLALRSGISTKSVIDQLKGIRCSSTIGKGLSCLSCPDAIGRLIEKIEKQIDDTYEYHPVGKSIELSETTKPGDQWKSFVPKSTCPNCKNELEHEGGCVICRNCGYSKCG